MIIHLRSAGFHCEGFALRLAGIAPLPVEIRHNAGSLHDSESTSPRPGGSLHRRPPFGHV